MFSVPCMRVQLRELGEAVGETQAHWRSVCGGMEAQCQALHDSRCALLTDAVEARQVRRQGRHGGPVPS